MVSQKPLAELPDHLRLSFKPNVTCRPTRNLWFGNVFSTFKRQNSVVKIGSWCPLPRAEGARSHGTTCTVVNPTLKVDHVTEPL